MFNDVGAQGVDNLWCTQNSVEVGKVSLTGVKGFRICLAGQLFIFSIDLGKDLLVELEGDDSTLVKTGRVASSSTACVMS